MQKEKEIDGKEKNGFLEGRENLVEEQKCNLYSKIKDSNRNHMVFIFTLADFLCKKKKISPIWKIRGKQDNQQE